MAYSSASDPDVGAWELREGSTAPLTLLVMVESPESGDVSITSLP